jgi:hypothetical protein
MIIGRLYGNEKLRRIFLVKSPCGRYNQKNLER